MIQRWLADWWQAHLFEFVATPVVAVLGLLMGAFVLWVLHRKPKPRHQHSPDFACTLCIQEAVTIEKRLRIVGWLVLIAFTIGAMLALSLYLG